jgi:hypothetical protein
MICMSISSWYTTGFNLRVAEFLRMEAKARARRGAAADAEAVPEPGDATGDTGATGVTGAPCPGAAACSSFCASSLEEVLAGGVREFEYHDLARAAMGRFGVGLTWFSVTTCQLGSVMAYLVFVATCLTDVIGTTTLWPTVLGLLPIVGSLALLRSTDALTFSSMMGNVALGLCLASIVGYGAAQEPPFLEPSKYEWGFDAGGVAVFFGISLFSFSSHCEILSIVQSVSDETEEGDGDAERRGGRQDGPDREAVLSGAEGAAGAGGSTRNRQAAKSMNSADRDGTAGATADRTKSLAVRTNARQEYRRVTLPWTYVVVTLLYIISSVLFYVFLGGDGRPSLPGIVFEAMTSTKEPFATLTKIVKIAMGAALLVQVRGGAGGGDDE